MTAEWHHVTERFHSFIGRLQPTPLERERARAAVAEATAALRRRFRPAGPESGGTDWPTDDSLLIGGHAKGTAVNPATTVDLLYVLPPYLHSGAARSHAESIAVGATLALGEGFAVLESAAPGWIVARAFDHTEVRVLPCFRGGGDTLRLALPGPWSTTNPASETARLHEADMASNGKATHLILMLKAWRRTGAIPLESLALELLVCEFVLAWIYPRRSLLFYDWMVRDFFFWLVHQARREMLTPGALECVHLGGDWVPAAAHAYARARRACEFERDNRAEAARDEWQAIFGPDFPSEVTPALAPPAADAPEAAADAVAVRRTLAKS